jgi:hypothetical protein
MADDTEYQREYDKAAAELEAAATATTARGDDGKFVKAETAPKVAEVSEEIEKAEEVDPLAELRARLEKAEKIAKDQQAWATRVSQENAAIKREQQQREREAKKPAILDANPDLADAIRYVAHDPKPQEQADAQREQFLGIVDKAHPGIFSMDADPELVKALEIRLGALGDAASDPLVVIREITEEKLAHAERNLGKRFAAESAKLAQKSAMSVPGAGSGSGPKAVPDAALAEVQRIQSMSDADFAKEVRRVKGY